MGFGLTFEKLASGMERTFVPFLEKHKQDDIKMVKDYDQVVRELYDNMAEKGLNGKEGKVLFAFDNNYVYFVYDDDQSEKAQIVILAIPLGKEVKEVDRIDF